MPCVLKSYPINYKNPRKLSIYILGWSSGNKGIWVFPSSAWWRHDMGRISSLLVLCVVNIYARNGRYNADDIFKCIFLKENVWIPTQISLKFVNKGPINNIPALVQIMAWCRPGDKPLSEPMMFRLPTHICVTRPQWVNTSITSSSLHKRPEMRICDDFFADNINKN